MTWRPFEPSRDERDRIERERDANTCNRHKDCASADEEARRVGKSSAFDCSIDDCEDCFGC